MWTMTNKPTPQKMSFALAKEFRDMEPCPHDRLLNQTRLERLQAKYDAGEFRSCLWAKAYCAETKKWYRINGKHTSTMLADLNGKALKGNPIFIVVEEYHCPTMEDVARLYSSFDSRISARNASDINRVFAATNPEISDVNGRTLNVVVAAITFAKWEDTCEKPLAEERAAFLLQFPGFVRWVHALTAGQEAAHVYRAPVMGAAFLTWQKSQKEATTFWTLVRDGSGTDHRSADRALQRYLLKTSCATGRGSTTGKAMAGRREMFVKCIHGWNAWRRGESTTLPYYATAKTPAVH